MTEHYWTPQSNVSNETSTNKTFQRTISAQVHTRLHLSVKSVTIKPADGFLLGFFLFVLFFLPSAGCLCLSLCSCQTLQDTLAYATALLNEKEQSGSSNGSDGSPANDNADRSLRQVVLGFAQTGWLNQRVSSIRQRVAQFTLTQRQYRTKTGLPQFIAAQTAPMCRHSWTPERDLIMHSHSNIYLVRLRVQSLPWCSATQRATSKMLTRNGSNQQGSPAKARRPQVPVERAAVFASDWSGHLGLHYKPGRTLALWVVRNKGVIMNKS